MSEIKRKERKNTCIYGLYKDGVCVMRGSAKELGEQIGANPQAVPQAYRAGFKCRGYTVKLETYPGKERGSVHGIPEELWQEWDKCCSALRNG